MLTGNLNKFSERADAIWLWLASRHPLWYLVVYVLAIWGFGTLYYYWLWSEFYAPYAHLEKQWLTDKREYKWYMENLGIPIGMEVSHEQVKSSINRKFNNPVSVIKNLTFNTDLSVEFNLNLVVGVQDDGSPELERHFECHVKFDSLTSEDHFISDMRGDPSYYLIEFEYQPSENCKREVVRDLFGYDKERAVDNSFFLPLDQKTTFQGEALALGFAGYPGLVGGNYVRMIYFSSVIITTLGLGDIVPIGMRARICVGAESVLGILLLGLFLNSVSWRATQSKDGEKTLPPSRPSGPEPAAHRGPNLAAPQHVTLSDQTVKFLQERAAQSEAELATSEPADLPEEVPDHSASMLEGPHKPSE